MRSIASLMLGFLAACSSLSEDEVKNLNNYKYNSKQYYQRGNFPVAEQQCRKGLELDDEDPSLNPLLGYALLRQQTFPKVSEAETVFQTVCDDHLYVHEYQARLGLGTAQHWLAIHHQNAKEPELFDEFAQKALSNLSRARELNPESIEASLTLGQVYVLRKSYREAISELDKGFEQLEKQRDFLEKRLEKTSHSHTSQAELGIDLRINEARQREFLNLKAHILHTEKNYEGALEQFALIEKLSELTPTDYYNRGLLHEDAGYDAKALADYDTFLRTTDRTLDDFVRDVIRKKAQLQVRLGVTDDASPKPEGPSLPDDGDGS